MHMELPPHTKHTIYISLMDKGREFRVTNINNRTTKFYLPLFRADFKVADYNSEILKLDLLLQTIINIERRRGLYSDGSRRPKHKSFESYRRLRNNETKTTITITTTVAGSVTRRSLTAVQIVQKDRCPMTRTAGA